MPSMANITVKKEDGTTDITYTAMSPSAGDKVPAIWNATSVSGVQGSQPTLSMVTAANTQNTYRHANFKYAYPHYYTDPDSGQEVLIATVTADAHVSCPLSIPQNVWDEAFTQFGNLLSAALIRDSVLVARAPT